MMKMQMEFKFKEYFIFLISLFFFSCTNDKIETKESGYPTDIEKILVNKCTNAGCHNTQSAGGAGGIDLSTWDNLFKGGRNGSPVIPYSSDYSFMLYFVNTYADLGIVLEPTMPLGSNPLSRSEVTTLRNWIMQGAPGKNGDVKFSDDTQRKKVYVANQACDQVAVFDAASRMIMRYIPVGVDDNIIETPHQIKISPDGQYWYVLFYSSNVIQKFRTSDDTFVGTINIGSGVWNTMSISPDGSKAFVSDLSLIGKVAYIDLSSMVKIIDYTGLSWPHGTWVSADGKTLYVTSQTGNFIYKIDITNPLTPASQVIVLQTGQSQVFASSLDPHEIIFSPDESKYFLTCQKSNEVRVMKSSNDSLIAVFPVGTRPQEMSLSTSRPYLFVTCQETPSADPKEKGSVAVIDYNTLSVVVPGEIYSGFQPHGIAVDDDHDVVYVANLNYDTNGPPPHHSTDCGGRNGYLSIIDMKTMQLLNITTSDGISYTYKNELLAFPYSAAYRK